MKGGVEIYPDSAGAERESGFHSEYVGAVAGVIGDGDAAFRTRFALGFEYHLGKPAGSASYHICVHPVGSRADYAAKPGSTEFKFGVEAFLD